MNPTQYVTDMQTLAAEQDRLAQLGKTLATQSQELVARLGEAGGGHGDFFITGLTVFALACFVGYYVVWRVTPALHSPLMAVTNAVSSVIIVGALIAAGTETMTASSWLGLIAIALAAVNIFGGFIVTQRMLQMYKKKKPEAKRS
jgi:H+-translocating NAD(P) transhydrogenase subunit alpha